MRFQQRKLASRVATAGIVVAAVLGTSHFAVLGATGDWPTYQHEIGRNGVDPDAPAATTLSPAWNTPLDGPVYAQPLFAGGRVYAATENDTIYALEAGTGATLWQNHLATPARLSQLPCGNIDPYGITSTPVIDTAAGVLYAVALQSSPSIHHELYALNVNAGGAVLYHYPIDAPGANPLAQGQRGALMLAYGSVYVPYAGRSGDCGKYTGSVVGASAGDAAGTTRTAYVAPNTSQAGIWTAGSADGKGNLFVTTGNGSATGGTPDRGESVVKLSSTLKELDFFTPANWASLNASDTDIGSIGPILLGNGWILQSGKSGVGYLLDSARLGGVGGELFQAPICPGQEALGFGAYLAPDTLFIPCTSSLKAVHVNTSGSPSFSVTTIRSGYGGWPGASPPILAGGVLWNLDAGNRLLLGFNPNSGQQLFSQHLAGTPNHFAAPSSGAGHLFVPSGSIVEAFNTIAAGVTPLPTSTATPTLTSTPTLIVSPMPSLTSTPVVVPNYSSWAAGLPEPIVRGRTVMIGSTVTSTLGGRVLIDVEVYDRLGNMAFQHFWDNQSLVAGKPLTLNAKWLVPLGAAAGDYTTAIGIFLPHWGTLQQWNPSAGTIIVTLPATATPTRTPLPTRTPRPTNTPRPTATPRGMAAPDMAVSGDSVGDQTSP